MSSSTPTDSRRHFSRIPFHTGALLRFADGEHAVTIKDLALKGALVEYAAPLDVALGARCDLFLPLADESESIELQCLVAHLSGTRFGLKCMEIDVDSLTNLRRLIELNLGDPALVDRELSQMFTVMI